MTTLRTPPPGLASEMDLPKDGPDLRQQQQRMTSAVLNADCAKLQEPGAKVQRSLNALSGKKVPPETSVLSHQLSEVLLTSTGNPLLPDEATESVVVHTVDQDTVFSGQPHPIVQHEPIVSLSGELNRTDTGDSFHSITTNTAAETEFDKMSSVSKASKVSSLTPNERFELAKDTLTSFAVEGSETDKALVRAVLDAMRRTEHAKIRQEERLNHPINDTLRGGRDRSTLDAAPTHQMTTRSKARNRLDNTQMSDATPGELDSILDPFGLNSNTNPVQRTQPILPHHTAGSGALASRQGTLTPTNGRGRGVTASLGTASSTPISSAGRGRGRRPRPLTPEPPPQPEPPSPGGSATADSATGAFSRLSLNVQEQAALSVQQQDELDQEELAPDITPANADTAYRPPGVSAPVMERGVRATAAPEEIRRTGNPRTAQLRSDGKIGDHCVVTRNVVPTQSSLSNDSAQNIISSLHPLMRGASENVNLWQHGVRLAFDWSLPRRADDAHICEVESRFTRYHRQLYQSPMWAIQWDDPLLKGQVPAEILNSYVPDRIVNFKLVSSTLRGSLRVSNEVCNALCTTPIQNVFKFNLDGLFLVGHIIAEYLWWIQRLDLVHALGNQRAEAILTIDVSAAAQAAVAQINVIERCNQQRRIVLPREALSATDLSVMAAIAQGVDFIALENRHIRLIHQLMLSDPILFCVYADAPIVIPAVAMFTYQDISASLKRLAKILQAEDDYVRGWCRAQTLLNGRVHSTRHTTQYLTAGLESERVRIAQPVGSSLVWMMLSNRWDLTEREADLYLEHQSMLACSMYELIRIGAVIAGLYGLGVSSIFNRANIGGRCLNMWARREPGDITTQMDNIAEARSTTGIPPLVRAATSLVTSMTGYVISWRSLRMSSWCGGMRHLNQVCPNDLYWSQIWAWYVPYALRPESVGWVLASLLSVWGLTGVYPSMSLDAEIIEGVEPQLHVLALYRGDSTYEVLYNSTQPHILFEYPAFVLNVMYQHMRLEGPMPISFKSYIPGTERNGYPDVGYFEADHFQPQFDENTRTIIPGTLLSYSWARGRFLAACVRRVRMPAEVWLQVRDLRPITDAYAGMTMRRPAERTHVAPRRMDLIGLLEAGEGAAAQSTAPTGQGNLEN
uniref:Uncharacterized protein n=1 Tax=Tzifr virus TaxID=2800945 RepID=A0A894KQ05_9VIRU|nr:MAG: hypothetical protein [Tzifr virus]